MRRGVTAFAPSAPLRIFPKAYSVMLGEGSPLPSSAREGTRRKTKVVGNGVVDAEEERSPFSSSTSLSGTGEADNDVVDGVGDRVETLVRE